MRTHKWGCTWGRGLVRFTIRKDCGNSQLIGNLTVMHNTRYGRGKVFFVDIKFTIPFKYKPLVLKLNIKILQWTKTVPQPYGAPCTCMEYSWFICRDGHWQVHYSLLLLLFLFPLTPVLSPNAKYSVGSLPVEWRTAEDLEVSLQSGWLNEQRNFNPFVPLAPAHFLVFLPSCTFLSACPIFLSTDISVYPLQMIWRVASSIPLCSSPFSVRVRDCDIGATC